EPEPANVNDEHNDPSGKKGHNIHCDLCGRRFTNLDAFVRHQRDHDVFREFACPKCNYPCKSAHALKIHLERKRCERKYEYKCDQCAYVTKKRYELEGHKQKHAAAAIATDCPPELIAEDSMEAELEKIGRQEPVVKKKPVSSVSFKVKCKLPLQKKKKEKVSEDEESQRFICRLCNRRYASRLSFANHRSRHELNKEFECSVCHYPCDSAVALEGHLLRKLCNTRGSLNKQKATYKCETCPYSTESEREYNKHFNTHKPKPQNTESSLAKPKPTEYTCETCPYSTESKRQYNQHLNTHKPQPPVELKLETADGRFKCRVCNQTFATLRGVTVHKRSQHPELGLVKFQCDRCPKVYTKADALRDHISKAHLKKCKYYCETCGRGMMKLSEYETHKLKHQAVKSFVCDICGSAYTYAHGLRKHLNEYHNDHSSEAAPGKFNCKFCDEKFSDRLQFNIHLKGAHQDLYVHKCEQCDSSYLSVASLQLHKRINHTLATAPVHCQFCNKQVASEVYLYSHIKNYCKKKPPGFQYSIPGVISRRKRNEEDFSNIQVDS
ncbi:putative zinc finger protein, partial [Orchesella cincta]